MKRKIIFTMLMFLFSGGVAVSAWKIYQELREYEEGTDTYVGLTQYIEMPDGPEEEPDKELGKSGPEPDEGLAEAGRKEESVEGTSRFPTVDFAALKSINPDIVGWVYIEGTAINYPIVQGTDNQYYLDHLFDGNYNSSGCIFLERQNAADFSDQNSIIYGHHMKNGSMFASLKNYKSQEYYENHPTAILLTPKESCRVKLFAGYVSDVEEGAWKIDFGTQESFKAWLEGVKKRSWFSSEITPAATSRVLTLSTCSYEFENAKFVLYGEIVQEVEN